MNSHNLLQKPMQEKQFQHFNGLDPVVILSLIWANWYYFLIAIALGLFGSSLFIKHTMPIYRSTCSILVNETEDRPLVNNEELLQGLGLPGGMRNLENQIMILKSKELTEKTLEALPFEVGYYFKTIRNKIPIYPDIPIQVIPHDIKILPRDIEFSIEYLGNNEIIVKSESEYFNFNKRTKFGEEIEISENKFRIDCSNPDWFALNNEDKIYFIVYSEGELVSFFNQRIEVELVSRGGSVLNVSLAGTNKSKDVDFLNKLAEVFQSLSLERKNIEAERRIQFINDQLVGISDSLLTTENKLQQFRSSNRIMDVSAQGQAIIAQVTQLEFERDRLNLEANYYDYLADYLAKDVSKEIPIVPITMGITDPGLTRLVEELASLQQQSLNKGAGELNPLQGLLNQKITSTKEALLETLNGLRRANSLARSENEEQINRVNRQASTLPVTERQLLGIERKFKLNDELYTFLLETRANQQMQKASNSADSELIDPAKELYSEIIAPSPPKVYFFGVFAGLVIPFLIIYLRFIFNKKLKDEEIRRLGYLPIVGNIPHNPEKNNLVVFDNPASSITEGFRLMRSRMHFFTKDAKSPVILITSSMPEEGKTFTSINLAAAYSLLGKNTILVGFDLRKPKIFQDFNLSNEKGVSTWLIGRDILEDIIQKTKYDNLYFIAAGPVPPNPSELSALDKASELIKLLRERFDYIIIDSSPIGLVSDTFNIASLADACVLVVRPERTLRDILETSIREIENSGVRGASMVINDIAVENKAYSFGDKYGYTNDIINSKRSRLFRWQKGRNKV